MTITRMVQKAVFIVVVVCGGGGGGGGGGKTSSVDDTQKYTSNGTSTSNSKSHGNGLLIMASSRQGHPGTACHADLGVRSTLLAAVPAPPLGFCLEGVSGFRV